MTERTHWGTTPEQRAQALATTPQAIVYARPDAGADYLGRTIAHHTAFVGDCDDCGRPTATTVDGAPRHACCATQVAQGHLGPCDGCDASNAELRRRRGDDRGPDRRSRR